MRMIISYNLNIYFQYFLCICFRLQLMFHQSGLKRYYIENHKFSLCSKSELQSFYKPTRMYKVVILSKVQCLE
jgi:hypothetical protein